MGEKILRGSNAYDAFGPKIIASYLGPGDVALESRALFVVARPLSKNISGLTPIALESIAEQLQPKLLAFRLNNYERLRSASASFTVSPDSSPRVQQIGRALALPIAGDAELESKLLAILEANISEAGVGRDAEPEWFVALALLSQAHALGPGAPVYWSVKEIAESARSNADHVGTLFIESDRRTGSILRALGLKTRIIGSKGRGFKSSSQLKDQIHEIAKTLGICVGDLWTPDLGDAPVTCERCARYRLNFDNEGRKLRFSPIPRFIHEPDPED